MNKMKTVIISVLAVSILVIGLVAFAGNRFGAGSMAQASGQMDGTCLYLNQYDADGDGIPNCDDADWEAPMDGTGYGAMNGNGKHLCDGTGYGAMNGNGRHLADGSRLGRGNGTGICRVG